MKVLQLKALAILSDTNVRRSAVDWVYLKQYWKSEKRPHFSRWSTILLFSSFSKTLRTTERRLIGRQFLAVDLFPTFPYRNHQWNLPTMWKRKLPQTLIEEFSYCVWKSRLTVLQNHHWNAIRIWWINVRYALFNHLGGYRNIMLSQISSRRKNRSRDTRVIKIRVFENVFRTQFCFIRYRRQHLRATE